MGKTFSVATPFDAATAKWNLKRWMGVADFSWIGISDACDSIVIDAPNGNVAALIAERGAGAGADAAMIKRIANELGLNDPLPMRYLSWLGHALTGDFGVSLRTGKPISQEFAARIPISAALLAGGGVLVFFVALGAGLAGAASNGGLADRRLHGFALIGASTPNFFVAALLVIVFSVMLGWVPTPLCPPAGAAARGAAEHPDPVPDHLGVAGHRHAGRQGNGVTGAPAEPRPFCSRVSPKR